MTKVVTPVALDVFWVCRIVRCYLGMGGLAVCGALDRWAPTIEDIVTVSETVLTATTSWLSFVVGALGRWALAIEDILTMFQTVFTSATAWEEIGSVSGFRSGVGSTLRGVMTKVMTPVALDVSSV